MKRTFAIAAATALLFTACDTGADTDTTTLDQGAGTAQEAGSQTAQRATAMLRDSAGRDVGSVVFDGSNGGVRISAQVAGIAPGEHGIHVHMVGQCDAPGFESAGDHLNPTNTQHGLENPNGPHLGDMPNLTVADDSTGSVSFENAQLQLGQGGNLLDGDGAAVVVHADRDDQTTDPSGNSGARIACGVIQAG